MVAVNLKHSINWQAPLPMWVENSSMGLHIHNDALAAQPAILGFASDSFMDDLLHTMQDNPARIVEWMAQPETWREPMMSPQPAQAAQQDSGIAYLLNKTKALADRRKSPLAQRKPMREKTRVTVAETNLALKLYQSTHQRFYLVTASLLKNTTGIPDHAINLGKSEKTSFVVRRLVPPQNQKKQQNPDNFQQWDEYAFVPGQSGGQWQYLGQYNEGASRALLSGEERLPMFPLNYADACCHDRTIHSGLIPVGKREVWMAGSVGNSLSGTTTGSSRAQLQFQIEVGAPWKTLISQAQNKQDALQRSVAGVETSGDASEETDRAYRTERDAIQTASWYILLDLAHFLQRHVAPVWAVIQGRQNIGSLNVLQQQFYQVVASIEMSNALRKKLVELPRKLILQGMSCSDAPIRYCKDDVKVSLIDALKAIDAWQDRLESVENEFVRYLADDTANTVDENWPDFLFAFADPQLLAPLPDKNLLVFADFTGLSGVDLQHAQVDALAKLIGKMLPASSSNEDVFSQQPVLDQRDAWFVIRCVYERPGCGPLFPALLSQPTQAFQLAAFFDPDAPARPIRIPMPVDVSPAGLRKFKKNTAFVISDMLCGKIKKIRKITLGDLVLSVLPWPFHKDLPNPGDTGPCQKNGIGFGMICSLSIPIVTLCALILLMIMVSLFDLFFRWIPYFIMCLPIPGLSGKDK